MLLYSSSGAGALWDGPALPRPRLVLPARPVAALAVTLARAVHPGSVVSLTVDGAGAAGRGGWATVSTVPLEFAPTALAGPGGLLEVRATFALTDADYPRVQALWPAATAYTAQVDAPALALSLARAVGLSGRRSVIGLRLAPEEVTVIANPDAAHADADEQGADEGAADVAGTTGSAGPIRQEVHTPAPGGAPELTDAPEVGMTPAFLADTLAAFGGTVTIGGTDDRKPWTFTDKGPVRVLLMPVKLTPER